jgi:hypothetical protein
MSLERHFAAFALAGGWWSSGGIAVFVEQAYLGFKVQI